jgi:hypothetical protein
MRAATSFIDPSILPDQARRELHDFYSFLVGKYAKRHARPTTRVLSTQGTAGALAASPIVGIWKDRDLGDSAVFARSLRDKAQNRTSA